MDQSLFLYPSETLRTGHAIGDVCTQQFSFHCHTYYEVYYFVRGDVSYRVENVEYHPTPHSLLLFAPGVLHGIRIDSCAPYERYTVHFNPCLLAPEASSTLLSPFSSRAHSYSIFYQDVDQFGMAGQFEALAGACGSDADIRQQMIRIHVECLLSKVLLMSRAQHVTLPKSNILYPAEPFLDYINSNLVQPLSLNLLADLFFLSKAQLCKQFKQATGVTIMDYITRKRIALARQLMSEGCSAGTAATKVGFRDYSVFFRACKKIYDCAPSKFHSEALF